MKESYLVPGRQKAEDTRPRCTLCGLVLSVAPHANATHDLCFERYQEFMNDACDEFQREREAYEGWP